MVGQRCQQLGSPLHPMLPGLRKLNQAREIVDELPQIFIHGQTLSAGQILEGRASGGNFLGA